MTAYTPEWVLLLRKLIEEYEHERRGGENDSGRKNRLE
jgi:hypothetical protein